MPIATDILSDLRELLPTLHLEDIKMGPSNEMAQTPSKTPDLVQDIHKDFQTLVK